MTRLYPVLVVAACASPASPQLRAPQSGPRPRPPSSRALPGYPPPEEPAAVTCAVAGTWSPDQPNELRFRRGGRTVVTVYQAKRATVSLGEDPASPFVELSSPHGRLWGVVMADRLLLHPARAMLFDGYLVPGPTALLRWLGAAAEPVPIGVQLPELVRPASPPRDDLRCADLSLDEPDFQPRAAIDAPEGEHVVFVEGKPIPIARELNGAAVADLVFESSPGIEVIERRGDRARVIVEHSNLNPAENVLVVGWVAASALVVKPTGFGGSWGSGGAGSGPLPRPHRGWQMVSCPREVPLVAELEGEQHLIGAVAAGVPLELPPGTARTGERLVEIVVRSRQMAFADDVRVLTQGAALAGCTAAHAPE